MVYCVAPNCKSKSCKGIRLFRFPRDGNRRAKWIQNSRRDKWQPTDNSRLCEFHFEESQFELQRADGRKLLKWNAVPTIFNVPNPPKLFASCRKPPKEREFHVKEVGAIELVTKREPVTENLDQNNEMEELRLENSKLKSENKKLKDKLDEMEKRLQQFLRNDQIQYLQRTGTSNPCSWTNQTVLHALQVKCAVGNKGYEYLRSIEYPLPSSKTLNRKLNCATLAKELSVI